MKHTQQHLLSEIETADYLNMSRSFLRQGRMNGDREGRTVGQCLSHHSDGGFGKVPLRRLRFSPRRRDHGPCYDYRERCGESPRETANSNVRRRRGAEVQSRCA